MLNVASYTVREVGKDYIVLADSRGNVRVNFADDDALPNLKKEETAASFQHLVGKSVALPEPIRCDPPGRLFIAVDILRDIDNSTRAIPNYFAIASIEQADKPSPK